MVEHDMVIVELNFAETFGRPLLKEKTSRSRWQSQQRALSESTDTDYKKRGMIELSNSPTRHSPNAREPDNFVIHSIPDL
jgi:hypothetical protein